jgi:hypothetical protein
MEHERGTFKVNSSSRWRDGPGDCMDNRPKRLVVMRERCSAKEFLAGNLDNMSQLPAE